MKTQRPDRRGWLARLLLPLATAAFLMTSSTAAQAHDVLVSSDPANGSTVSSVPTKVGLTFDHTPIAINSIVRVEDATGTDQANGQSPLSTTSSPSPSNQTLQAASTPWSGA